MRRRQLKWLWARLEKLTTMRLTRDGLLMKLGAAQTKTPAAWRLIEVEIAKRGPHFTYRLDREELRAVRRREGRYPLRTNLTEADPAKLWQFYLQLVEVEAAFKSPPRTPQQQPSCSADLLGSPYVKQSLGGLVPRESAKWG